jgi:hypothetical protein
MAVLYTFRKSSICRQVRRELMRSALLEALVQSDGNGFAFEITTYAI